MDTRFHTPLRRSRAKKIAALVSVAVSCLPGTLPAQTDPAPYVIGTTHQLHSDVLGQDRQIIVHLPQGYEGSQQHYPVMYLLDGDAHFHHTTGITQFLTMWGYMPATIVVAIPHPDRTRDLTPEPSARMAKRRPTAGGADEFLRFLSDELIPWVEGQYRTASFRVLVGHSLGGLFATHALLVRPEVFDAYISASPALGWNDRALVAQAEATIEQQPWGGRFFYMTMGNEGGDMLPATEALASVFEASAPDGFDWQFHWMEEEAHGTIPHRTIYNALEWLFMEYRVPPDLMALGIGGLDLHYATISERYYEMDTPEAMISQLGYSYLRQGDEPMAIETFTLNVERFPGSANVYDSLGDAYYTAGESAPALENYERAYRMSDGTQHPFADTYRGKYQRLTQEMATGP
jgi:predicted alpha/beta superfamily hydrolase